MLGKVRRIWREERWGVMGGGGGQRGRRATKGDSGFSWGTIRGTS